MILVMDLESSDKNQWQLVNLVVIKNILPTKYGQNYDNVIF